MRHSRRLGDVVDEKVDQENEDGEDLDEEGEEEAEAEVEGLSRVRGRDGQSQMDRRARPRLSRASQRSKRGRRASSRMLNRMGRNPRQSTDTFRVHLSIATGNVLKAWISNRQTMMYRSYPLARLAAT